MFGVKGGQGSYVLTRNLHAPLQCLSIFPHVATFSPEGAFFPTVPHPRPPQESPIIPVFGDPQMGSFEPVGILVLLPVAGYPEGHPNVIGESGKCSEEAFTSEMAYLKEKVDAGGRLGPEMRADLLGLIDGWIRHFGSP